MTGWVCVYRDLQNHWLWEEKPFSKGQAWIDLILMADYQANKIPYKGEIITTERGVVNRSISWLAKRWGWGRDKARAFLHTLEDDNMVITNATKHRTTITIVNYGKYQDYAATNTATNTATDPQPTSQPTRNQPDINNKYNNNNNINKETNKNKGGRAAGFTMEGFAEFLNEAGEDE